jgi:hypothetical protein
MDTTDIPTRGEAEAGPDEPGFAEVVHDGSLLGEVRALRER